MRPLTSRIARFARERTVLVVSALAALATVAFVPPDEAYLGYFDVKTLACLFGILAVVGALRGIGLFEHAARLIVARFFTCRSAVAALVGSTLVLSMFATNDLALIMMLPLSAATLLKAGWERSLPFAFIMQNLAANLGGMILPFGNPQNLYLYERFSIPLGDFLSSMALPFAVSVVLIALCCVLFAKPEPPKATKKTSIGKRGSRKRRDEKTSGRKARWEESVSGGTSNGKLACR
ncbi:SLC13 family permease [Gordonibacter urolithinfaciens]|uniref:SLC13 family permease n=1 Tax=Gordonibacter urolithinfaciens TaxID=1335613 RepID=UPI001E3EEE54|nr:SLC13 family permease [Gordonibacter urolithinfaciens]